MGHCTRANVLSRDVTWRNWARARELKISFASTLRESKTSLLHVVTQYEKFALYDVK